MPAISRLREKNLMPARNKIALVVVFVAIVLTYMPSLWGGFVFDDKILMSSPVIQRASLSRVLTAGIKDILGAKHQNYWRPLAVMSVWLEYKIFGHRPVFYKVDQMVLHFLVALLFMVFFRNLLRDKFAFPDGTADVLAFLMGFAWAIHPSHAEVVATVSGRYDILAGLFSAAAGILFLKAEKISNSTKQDLAIAAGGGFYFLGLLSKEAAAPLPVFLAFLMLFPQFSKRVILKTVGFMIVIFAALYFPVRQAILGDTGQIFRHQHFWGGLFNTPYILAKYLQMMVAPYFPRPVYFIDIFTVAFDLRTLLAWWIFFPFAAMVVWAIWKKLPEGAGFGWYFSFIAPVIGIFYVAGTIVAERFLYTPSVGLIFAAVVYLYRRGTFRSVVWKVILVIYLMSWSITAFWYIDTAWTTQLKIADYTVKHCPNVQVGYLLGAVENIKRGNPEKAVEYLRECARRVENCTSEICRPMAIAHTMLGDTDSAIYWYRRGLEFDPNDPQYHNNLGVLLLDRGELDSARYHFEKALESNPNYRPAYRSLIRYYLVVGDTAAAAKIASALE